MGDKGDLKPVEVVVVVACSLIWLLLLFVVVLVSFVACIEPENEFADTKRLNFALLLLGAGDEGDTTRLAVWFVCGSKTSLDNEPEMKCCELALEKLGVA